jgi:plasmid maintenance system antidote protein VapI
MSIPNTRERQVRATHPGEMLRDDFMPDYGLTVSEIAKALGGVAPEGQRAVARTTGGQP